MDKKHFVVFWYTKIEPSFHHIESSNRQRLFQEKGEEKHGGKTFICFKPSSHKSPSKAATEKLGCKDPTFCFFSGKPKGK